MFGEKTAENEVVIMEIHDMHSLCCWTQINGNMAAYIKCLHFKCQKMEHNDINVHKKTSGHLMFGR